MHVVFIVHLLFVCLLLKIIHHIVGIRHLTEIKSLADAKKAIEDYIEHKGYGGHIKVEEFKVFALSQIEQAETEILRQIDTEIIYLRQDENHHNTRCNCNKIEGLEFTRKIITGSSSSIP